MKKTLIFLSLVVMLFGCNENNNNNSSSGNVCDIDCEVASMEGYEGFEDTDHVFLDINFDKANTYIQDENFTGIIYFGFATCPWCIHALPIMNDVAKSLDLNVYYVDKKSEENEANPEWLETTTKLLDEAYGLEKDDDGNPRIYVPEVIVVKNGEVIDHHLGTLDDHDATEREMSDTEKTELTSIYEKMFKKIK